MVSQNTDQFFEFQNPFDDWDEEEVKEKAREFARGNGLHTYEDFFVRGGLLNLNPEAFQSIRQDGHRLSQEECNALNVEQCPKSGFDRFRQTRGLYLLVALCSAAAAGTSRESGPHLHWIR